ncbi:DUF7738 domain-containing protein [Tenacibaculum amylolyticum]|uniref:DUF7738 domain-containing protein n=1 Tax=Tenacibaculum amylolyticum TaxID=104269 RepID=UPI003893ECF7
MLNLFKKKKQKEFIIHCNTDSLLINDTMLDFPTNHVRLTAIFGEPTRRIASTNEYLIWDDYGFSCTIQGDNTILSVNVYQSNNVSEYVAKKPFTGKLYLEDKDITYNEFGKIGLGKVAIHRLGSENETRFGFSIGINKDYKD